MQQIVIVIQISVFTNVNYFHENTIVIGESKMFNHYNYHYINMTNRRFEILSTLIQY